MYESNREIGINSAPGAALSEAQLGRHVMGYSFTDDTDHETVPEA